METFLNQHPEFRSHELPPAVVNRGLLEEYVQPAIDFASTTGKPLYCGEYGVIDNTSIQSRIHWHRDFVGILKELGIGRACWSYKQMNFGLVDRDGRVISEELVRIVSDR